MRIPAHASVILVLLVGIGLLPATGVQAGDRESCRAGTGDQAVDACTRLIQTGDAKGRRLAAAYGDRGYIYAGRGDFSLALADYDESLRLDPRSSKIVSDRAAVYAAQEETARAIAGYSQAIRLDPKFPGNYRWRGLVYFYNGKPKRAAADIHQAQRLDPKDGYSAIWSDIVARRGHAASRLRSAARGVDMTKWPAPVIRLFLGQATPPAVMAAAQDPDPDKMAGQVCEARFYSGLMALGADARPEAIALFRAAAASCPKIFVEWSAARSELKRLGETP